MQSRSEACIDVEAGVRGKGRPERARVVWERGSGRQERRMDGQASRAVYWCGREESRPMRRSRRERAVRRRPRTVPRRGVRHEIEGRAGRTDMPAQQDLVPEVLQLEVNDWPVMAAFYREVLGFEPIFLEPDQQYGWLQAGPLKVALRGGASPGGGHGARSTLLFRVADVRRTMAALESSGCHFHDQQLAPTGHSYQVAYFSDPEGNALAIFSDPDI